MHIQIFGNINGGYKPIQQNLFEQAGKQEQQLIFMKDIDLRKGMPEIKVDISKEGLRALHGSRLKGQVNFEEQEKERKFLSEHQPVDSFSNGFRKALENLKQKDENEATIEEKGQAVTDAFKSMVDEIVAGYADDKRLRFVEADFEDLYRVEWMKGVEAVGLDREAKKVILDQGEPVSYDKLLIATGSHTFFPPIKNMAGAKNMIGFRNIDDIEVLKKVAEDVIASGGKKR